MTPTRLLRLGLECLCAGLVVLIAAELIPAFDTQTPSPARIPLPPPRQPASSAMRDAMIAELSGRPLFSPDRNHLPPPPMDEEPADKQPPQLQGRLAGVVIRPGIREALFARMGQKPVTVKIGDEIDGWKISAIETDRVTLTSASGDQTVKPTNGLAGEGMALEARAIVKKPAAAKAPADAVAAAAINANAAAANRGAPSSSIPASSNPGAAQQGFRP